MSETEEIWKDVVGLEGFYEVSNKGRVRRGPRPGKAAVCGKVLSPAKTGGYFKVNLSAHNSRQMFFVHRLVAWSFIGPPPSPFHVVAHWDGDGTNNCVENLRWATAKENAADNARNGVGWRGERASKARRGHRNPNSNLTPDQVRAIRSDSRIYKVIAADYGLSKSGVSAIKARRSWRYLED